jgi:uncharacterized protein
MGRSLLWSRVGQAGLEHLELANGSADGLVIALDDDGAPFRLLYRVEWDTRWRTRRVTARTSERALDLRADGDGRWTRDGAPAPELDGCLDVDLWPTPFTNTLPLRRLDPSGRCPLRVAWIEAPLLTVRPMPQAYTRLERGRYLFEALDSAFRAELTVDDEKLVVEYPGLFRRVLGPPG